MLRLNSRLRLVSVGALALAAVSPAHALPSVVGDDDPTYQGAPQGVGRGLSLSANLRTLYDSNILRRGDGLTPRPGDSKADFRISPSASAQYGLPFGRQLLYVEGTVGRDYYLRNTRLNRNRYDISGGAALAAGSSCTATLDGRIAARQVLFSEIGDLVPNSQQTVSYGAAANCASPVGLGFGGNVRQTQVRNDNPVRKFLNHNATSFGGQLSYGLGSIGTFSASASRNKVTYTERTVLLPAGTNVQDRVSITSGRLGFQRSLGTRLALTMGLSYFESRPNPTSILTLTPTVPPLPPGFIVTPVNRTKFSGLGYDASISYSPSERLSLLLAANRSASASVNVGAVSQVRTGYVVDANYQLSSALSVGTGVSFRHNRYQDPVIGTADLGLLRNSDQINRVYANVSYQSPRLFVTTFELGYQQRKSDPVAFNFSGFTASLNLTAKFGRNS